MAITCLLMLRLHSESWSWMPAHRHTTTHTHTVDCDTVIKFVFFSDTVLCLVCSPHVYHSEWNSGGWALPLMCFWFASLIGTLAGANSGDKRAWLEIMREGEKEKEKEHRARHTPQQRLRTCA